MKNKFRKILLVALSIVFAFSCLAGCGENTKTPKGNVSKQSFLPEIDQDKWLFGMCELAVETMNGSEPGATSEWIAKNNSALGVKSHRIWMHIPNVIEREANSNKLSIKRYEADKYHDFIDELKSNGVERLLAMSHQFLYPYDYVKMDESDLQVAIHPIEEPEFYKTWIEMYYDCYKLLAEEFPEIMFWEAGNEFDSIPFFRRNDGSLMNATDMGFINADLCYATNKAIKEVNPNNACVFPGLTTNQFSATVLESAYTYIEEKKLPTIEDYYVDDPDDYFDIVAWHPYGDGRAEKVKTMSLQLYGIMKEHGDSDKRVFLTELGITEHWRLNESNPQQSIADDMIDIMKMIKYDLPFVETVFFFRMTNCYSNSLNAKEDTFGLYYSPSDPEYKGKPKAIAIELFKYFNGENADTTPLYWFYNS